MTNYRASLEAALMHWSDHNQSAIAELRNGDLEKAAIYARLTEAAARVAEAAAKVTGT